MHKVCQHESAKSLSCDSQRLLVEGLGFFDVTKPERVALPRIVESNCLLFVKNYTIINVVSPQARFL
jgi:hypothetical protein